MSGVLTRFMNNAEKCGICLNPVSYQGKLSCCNHNFCFDCITKWSQTENSCPLCKDRFHTITKIVKRTQYRNTRADRPVVIEVSHKNQCAAMRESEMVNILELMLTHELDRLFELLDRLNV
ncbi:unnamed protein product [Blepharisma stoltei]|uniref:RING-type domain-containing protein n=1 Tax=Blepharisma stoltei TaxID=1481888 RepID=A0AAU9K0L2_9CILI|nr:unnamed protein product [Blepharisma stoltei]